MKYHHAIYCIAAVSAMCLLSCAKEVDPSHEKNHAIESKVDIPDDAFQREFLGYGPDRITEDGIQVYGSFHDDEVDKLNEYVMTRVSDQYKLITILRMKDGDIQLNVCKKDDVWKASGKTFVVRRSGNRLRTIIQGMWYR